MLKYRRRQIRKTGWRKGARRAVKIRAPRHRAVRLTRRGRWGQVRVAPLKKSIKAVDPRVAQVMKVYAEAMRHFNHQNLRRAKEIFERVVTGPSRELAERARVHLAICEQRLRRPAPPRLRGAEDHYHYAVSQINFGHYEEARAHLEKARKLAPKADYIHYALASAAALSGESDDALEHLGRAIRLRPENRYHARNDADFKLLEEDIHFQELLYPERLVGSKLGELRT